MERQFLHSFSKIFGKLERSVSFLWSPSVAPPSSQGPSPPVGSWACQCFLHMLAAGWSCPTQTGYQQGAGSNEAPWDDNCSQIQVQALEMSSNYHELVLQVRSRGPSCTSVRKSPASSQVISYPKEDMGCPGWACLPLQLHKQPCHSRLLTELQLGVRTRLGNTMVSKLTGTFSLATGPGKGLCSTLAAF